MADTTGDYITTCVKSLKCAAAGSVPAVRLLLERGAQASGAVGALALRLAQGGELATLLRAHGAL